MCVLDKNEMRRDQPPLWRYTLGLDNVFLLLFLLLLLLLHETPTGELLIITFAIAPANLFRV